jgi:hypothetical protein
MNVVMNTRVVAPRLVSYVALLLCPEVLYNTYFGVFPRGKGGEALDSYYRLPELQEIKT